MRIVNENWLVILEDMKHTAHLEGVTLSAIPDSTHTPFATHEYLAQRPDALYTGHYFDNLGEALADFNARVTGNEKP